MLRIAVPRSGSYNASSDGKPLWMASNPPLSTEEAAEYDAAFADRWRSLLPVDDLVAAVFEAVDLSDTYVFYASDHGFHLGGEGDHGMWTKHSLLENALRVPLIFVPPGGSGSAVKRVDAPVELLDIFPTLCEMRWGAKASVAMEPGYLSWKSASIPTSPLFFAGAALCCFATQSSK